MIDLISIVPTFRPRRIIDLFKERSLASLSMTGTRKASVLPVPVLAWASLLDFQISTIEFKRGERADWEGQTNRSPPFTDSGIVNRWTSVIFSRRKCDVIQSINGRETVPSSANFWNEVDCPGWSRSNFWVSLFSTAIADEDLNGDE